MPTFTPGNEFAVNSTTEENQGYSSLAALESGGFVAVWDHTVIDAGTSIQMLGIQRFDEAGNKVGDEILRPMAEQQEVGGFTDVTALKGGGFVVTWRTINALDDSHEEIAAQLFNDNGTPKGEQFTVNTVTESEQIHAEVAAHENGGFMIVWQTEVVSNTDTDISAQIFDANGNTVGGEFKVNTTTAGEQESAQVTMLSDGNYIVVWEDREPSNSAVRAQVISPTGQLVGNEQLINQPSTGNSIDPSIAVFEGGFVVAWGATGFFDQEVRAQLFDNDGTPNGESFQVNTHTESYQSTPTVVTLKDGGFVVTYTSSGDWDGDGHGIAGQQFDVSGNKVGDEFVVNEATDDNQLTSTSLALKNGGYVVTWDTPDPSGGFFEYDIKGRVFSPVGTSVDPSGPQRLVGGEGADKLTGADENDLLMGNGGTDNLTGAGGDDVLLGGEGADVLKGNAGKDIMFAGAGDDLIWAGSGDDSGDTIVGGAGNDRSGGGGGDDFMVGGGGAEGASTQLTTYVEAATDDGSDTLFGADGNDTILGGGWDDSKVSDNGKFDVGEQITSGTDSNELWAGSGDDLIYGAAGADKIGAKDGADTVYAGGGHDTVYGGSSDDADVIHGEGGNDFLFSGAGKDTVDGGAGSDVIFDGSGDDQYTGGTGSDTFFFGSSGGTDVVVDFDVFNDTLNLADTETDFQSTDDVKAAATAQSGGVLIDLGGNNSVLLEGLSLVDLDTVVFEFQSVDF